MLVRDNPLKAGGVTSKVETFIEKINCPYCLYHDYATRFQIKNKSGKVSEKRFKCPDCGEVMQRKTLFKQMSVEEYAEWIFDTQAWERIRFEKFKVRLREMGIAYQFWEHYKKYKDERVGETESYEDYLMRKQEEERASLQPGEG